MIRDKYEDDIGELFEFDHVSAVWFATEQGYRRYLPELLKPLPVGPDLSGLADLGRIEQKKGAPKITRDPSYLEGKFRKALDVLQVDAGKYKKFFEPETIEEYRYSPGAFKGDLNRDCPIIRKTLMSKHPELLEWRKRYNSTQSATLLDMFNNLIEFHADYVAATTDEQFRIFDAVSDFEFEPIEDDEECRIEGVIGMGIKSAVVHNLTPSMFPNRNRLSLLGFYLLSGCDPFGLSSKSSEFIMYDPGKLLPDGTIYGSHNYWYPYALFALYSTRLFRVLKADLAELGVFLDDDFRFVYTTALLLEICKLETEKIRTFLARDVIKSREDF
jgi:hypothetical protein